MKIAIAVLAAGRSTRMRGVNKLLQAINGEPLVRRSVRQALLVARDGIDVVVVIGSMPDDMRSALDGLPVSFVENSHFETGMASSIRSAVAAASSDADGLMIHLADMPDVSAADLEALIGVFVENGGQIVVQACHGGQAGNPAILPRHMFEALMRLEGDIGARHLIREAVTVQVEIGGSASLDIDTPEALEAYIRRAHEGRTP